MTKLIDYTYMTGDIRLALGHDTEAFDSLVESKQDDYLKLCLGEIEYLNFVDDLTNNVPASTKWLNFLNGCTLNVKDKNDATKSVQYLGFKNFLAYAMYVEYIKKFESKQTAAGNRQQTIDNSIHISPAFDIADIYGKAIRQFYGLDWAALHADYNAEWFGTNRYNCLGVSGFGGSYDYWSYYSMYYAKINSSAERIKGTIYNYLYYTNLETPTDFPDWNFTHVKVQSINILNL